MDLVLGHGWDKGAGIPSRRPKRSKGFGKFKWVNVGKELNKVKEAVDKAAGVGKAMQTDKVNHFDKAKKEDNIEGVYRTNKPDTVQRPLEWRYCRLADTIEIDAVEGETQSRRGTNGRKRQRGGYGQRAV